MDPNEALAIILDGNTNTHIDIDTLRDAAIDLDAWMTRRGFMPNLGELSEDKQRYLLQLAIETIVRDITG